MKRLVTLFILLGLSFIAVAEVLWVDDRLRLSLYAEPSSNSERIELLESGDELEVLGEYDSGFERVRSEAGNEGWVNDAFIVSSPPARIRIDSVEAERAELREQVERLQERLARTEAERDQARAASERRVSLWHVTAFDPLLAPSGETSTEPTTSETESAMPSRNMLLGLSLGGLLLLGLAGLGGWKLHEYKLRKRLGGLRL